MFDKTYRCEVDCEILTTLEDLIEDGFPAISLGSCFHSLLQVDAFDIDEAEEFCYDWFDLDSLNNDHYIYSCNCEVFN